MEFDDETLMLLNICASPETELIGDNLKTALINSFFTILYLDKKKANHRLTPFLKEILENISKSAADMALDGAPESIRDKVKSLFETQEKLEDILLTLGGESYRDHFKHSKRTFWLGNLLSRIKDNWGLERKKLLNFENCWYLIARFHDFCYMLERIKALVKGTEKTILEAFPSMGFSMDVDINLGGYAMAKKHLELLEYINLEKGPSSFLTKISFLEQLDREKHSILSALFIIDFMRKKNMVPEYFGEKDLRKMARAIAIHTDSPTQAVLRPQEDYFAALLILADEMQEWGRPSIEKDPSPTEGTELNNLRVDFKKVSKIPRFLDRLLNGSGKHRLPKLEFGLKDPFRNSLIVKKKDDEFRILLQIRFRNSKEFSEAIQKMQKEEEKRILILEQARNRASAVVRNLSSFGNSIGLKAVQLKPDDIITSKDDKSIILEIPMLRSSRLFPVNADKNLLSIVLTAILSTLSPFKRGNAPKVNFEDRNNQIIEFNIPHLEKSKISSKKRNLYRLNAFKWNWGIRIISKPTLYNKEEHIFPIKNVEDL